MTDTRNPSVYTCAEVRSCTRRARTAVSLAQTVVWSCGQHESKATSTAVIF